MAVTLWVTDEVYGDATLVMEDGKLDAPHWAVDAMQAVLDSTDGLAATVTGPWFDDPLSDPVGLYLLAMATFVIVDVDRSGDDPRALLGAMLGPTVDEAGNEVVF